MSVQFTEAKLKMVARSKFVSYTVDRLDEWYDIYTKIISNQSSNNVEIVDAANARQEIEACIELFLAFQIDMPNWTPADIIENKMGLDVLKLQKQTTGGLIAQDAVSKVTGSAKKASGSLGKMLLKWSQGQ